MNLKTLLTHINVASLEVAQQSDLSIELYGLSRFFEESDSFIPHILYWGQLSHLPALPPSDQPISFICFADGQPVVLPTPADNLNLIIIHDKDQAYATFHEIHKYCIEDPAITSGMNLMIDALFSDRGLQHMVDVAYEIFGNPMFIADSSYKFIAYNRSVKIDDSTLEEERRLGYILNENVQEIRKSRVSEKMRSGSYPYYHPHPQGDKGMLIVLIQIQGIIVAHIALYEMNRSFNNYDRLLLYRFAKLVSQELQKNRLFSENRGMMYSHMLADLLDNKVSSLETIQYRFRTLGYKLQENLYVITVNPQQSTTSELKLKTVSDQITRLLPNSIHVIYHESIVFLLNFSQPLSSTDPDFLSLEQYVRQNNLNLGISRCFTDISKLQQHYHQAIIAAELGERLNRPQGIMRYEDYSIYHMIEVCAEHDNLWNFLDPAINKLIEYDRANQTSMVETLKQALIHFKNNTAAAENLHIHKNTLFYRLEKIRKIIDCDLNDGDVMGRLQLSFKLIEYMNLKID